MWAKSSRLLKPPRQRQEHPLALQGEEVPAAASGQEAPAVEGPDPGQEAQEMLRQAEAMATAVREEAQALRAQAREEGYREGLATARPEAEALLAAAREEAEEIREAARDEGRRLREEGGAVILELAVATAERILRRELGTDPQAFLPAIQVALGMLGSTQGARLKVPQAVVWAFAEALGEVAVEGDPRLGSGDGFLLEGPGITVDGRISRQVERLRPVLAEALEGGWSHG